MRSCCVRVDNCPARGRVSPIAKEPPEKTHYSLTEARRRLTAIVNTLDDENPIVLTRRSQPVAVLISPQAYQRFTGRSLASSLHGFWDACQAWRRANPDLDLDAELDFIESLRDRSPGREVNFD